MNDRNFMKLAIAEAKNSLAAGGAPIGAIIVKDGEVMYGWYGLARKRPNFSC